MFVYRYGQNIKSPEFWDEVNFLKGYDDCLLTQLGFNKSCKGNGRIWHPRQAAPVIFSVFGSPYSPAEYQMFVYVSVNKSKGVSYPIHSYARFGGKWVGSIPAHPAYKKLSVKLYVRNKETGEVIWEKKDARFGRLFKLPTITLKNGDELGIGLQTLHHLLWGRY
jgi:hypothetical protein